MTGIIVVVFCHRAAPWAHAHPLLAVIQGQTEPICRHGIFSDLQVFQSCKTSGNIPENSSHTQYSYMYELHILICIYIYIYLYSYQNNDTWITRPSIPSEMPKFRSKSATSCWAPFSWPQPSSAAKMWSLHCSTCRRMPWPWKQMLRWFGWRFADTKSWHLTSLGVAIIPGESVKPPVAEKNHHS